MASGINASAAYKDVTFPNHGIGNLGLFFTLILVILPILFCFSHDKAYEDGLPVVNRSFSREPHFLSRVRWAVRARKILNNAYHKVGCGQ